MKRMMLAVVATMAVCTAQAVTWTWAATNATRGTTNLDLSFQSAPKTTVTYAAVLHGGIADAQTKSILLQLDSSTASGVGLNLEVEKGKLQARPIGFATNGGAEAYDYSLGAGANAFAIELIRGEGMTITMNFYLNGERIKNWVVGGGTDKTFDRLSWGQNSGGNNTNEGIYSVAMTTGRITAEDITVANLPEPTALALLALGVAGWRFAAAWRERGTPLPHHVLVIRPPAFGRTQGRFLFAISPLLGA